VNVDTNLFFREAVVRICGSLDIETALNRCLEHLQNFMPAFSMHLTLRLPELGMMRIVAVSRGAEVRKMGSRLIPVPPISWEAPENQRPGMAFVHIQNYPGQADELRELLDILEIDHDFSIMIMRLDQQGKYIGDAGIKAMGEGRFTEEHGRLFALLREPLALAMANALKHQEVLRLNEMLADDNRYLQRELTDRAGDEVVGADFGLEKVMNQVSQVAGLDSPVLLLGETGAGKGVLAGAIHRLSSRRNGPMVTVNCGAIPETLLDSELFGHEKGAFTGATQRKRGRFERAHKGTIFLDEIGELPPQAQVRLLNVLQNREIERVGGAESIVLDIRIIAATNRNLQSMVARGEFREDLWYRLYVYPVLIPPLRQRRQDIPALVHHFMERKSVELKLRRRPRLDHATLERLTAYDWPGNVRELENMIERSLIRSRGEWLEVDVPGEVVSREAEAQLRPEQENGTFPTLDEVNAEHIRRALQRTGGKISGRGGAAELLGMHPNTLRQRMDKLGVVFRRRERI
jgi:transcriptional regulator with GAF, ATPase, and Fis domain